MRLTTASATCTIESLSCLVCRRCCVELCELTGVNVFVVDRTAVLHSSGMWPDTLIVMTSDNGGDCQHGQPANNYPYPPFPLPPPNSSPIF